ncbi:hypothetical protein HDU96_010867 [Phlyctochytrium bullatum]|nr:hypothetical protein HDU96_010867 [Phlyctochytrium bullatum]
MASRSNSVKGGNNPRSPRGNNPQQGYYDDSSYYYEPQQHQQQQQPRYNNNNQYPSDMPPSSPTSPRSPRSIRSPREGGAEAYTYPTDTPQNVQRSGSQRSQPYSSNVQRSASQRSRVTSPKVQDADPYAAPSSSAGSYGAYPDGAYGQQQQQGWDNTAAAGYAGNYHDGGAYDYNGGYGAGTAYQAQPQSQYPYDAYPAQQQNWGFDYSQPQHAASETPSYTTKPRHGQEQGAPYWPPNDTKDAAGGATTALAAANVAKSVTTARPDFSDKETVTLQRRGSRADKRKSIDRSKFRGCLPRSPLFRIICLVVVLAILAVLVVFGWFFWPRFPQIQVLSITNESGGVNVSAWEFTIPKSAGGNLNKLSVKISFLMNVSCYNDNLYDLKVETINLDANLFINTTEIKKVRQPSQLKPDLRPLIGPAPLNPPANYVQPDLIPIGKGDKKDIVFPSRQNRTFLMNFTMTYTPDDAVGLLEDNAFKEILGVCGITSTYTRLARITYVARTTIGFLTTFGYKPEVNGQVLLKCPVDGSIFDNMINYYNANPNATAQEIITTVFETPIVPVENRSG